MSHNGDDVVEAVTLLRREDGTSLPQLKLGRVEPRTYHIDGEQKTEDAEVVELDDPASIKEVQSWGVEDYPERVQQVFFGVTEEGQ